MKKLIIALALFAGLAALAPQAEAKSKRVIVNNYYSADRDRGYDRGGYITYGGGGYREDGCRSRGGYRESYYEPAPVYYAPAPVYYAPRSYDSCRPRYYGRSRVAVSFGF